MNLSVKASIISGTVVAPPSKSYMQRAIALAALSKQPTTISNISDCADCRAAIGIARNLGCSVVEGDNQIVVTPPASGLKAQTLHCGEAGLSLRMFSPIAALQNEKVTMTGQGSLLVRPVGFMESTLRQLGVDVQSNQGKLPLVLQGPINGGVAEVDGSVSSQFLTGLLIALPLAANKSELKVDQLTSRPYIDMTLQIIEEFGGKVKNDNYELFSIEGNQQYSRAHYCVEGDWSGAAGLLIAASIAGPATVAGLNQKSAQADAAIMQVLKLAGTNCQFDGDKVLVNKNLQHKAFNFDATNCPDLFPVMAALAAHANGVSSIKGVGRLTHKESNRALAIQTEFGKLGIQIDLDGDVMFIHGGKVKGATVSACNDHRMAMALALCALQADGEVRIEGAECVAKSYPEFFDDMQNWGLQVSEF